eukprot:13575676-Alexandrium_andersonii.AAC.1
MHMPAAARVGGGVHSQSLPVFSGRCALAARFPGYASARQRTCWPACTARRHSACKQRPFKAADASVRHRFALRWECLLKGKARFTVAAGLSSQPHADNYSNDLCASSRQLK